MLEARFSDGGQFKKLVEALRDFKEINLECDEFGIRLKVMDECHVSLADMRLNSLIFEYYRCDVFCTLGLNMETLTRLIKLAPTDVPLVLCKDNNAESLKIESDEEVETGLKRAAYVRLIQVDGETLQIPNQSYQVEIDIPTKIYSLMIRDLSGVGEDVSITVTSTTIKFETDGERGRVENVFHRGQGAFATTNWIFDTTQSSASIQQAFAIRFLSGFSKASPLSDIVTLSMSSGVPLKLQFPIGEESYLAYYVAPALE